MMTAKDMTITVVGAGAAGLSLAGILYMHGYRVNLYNRSSGRIADIMKQGYYTLETPDNSQITVKPERITTNLKEAVEQAEVLVLAVNSNAQTEVVLNSIGHLKCDAMILLIPGHTGGAICLQRSLVDAGVGKSPTIVEFQALPFIARVLSNDSVKIFEYKKSVPVSSLPKCKIHKVIDRLQLIFANVVEAPSVLWTGLHNMTLIFQPVICLFNLTRFDSEDNFYFYRKGVNGFLGNVMDELDRERLEVGKALRIPVLISAADWIRQTYTTEGDSIDELIRNADGYSQVLAPPHPEKRFIGEHIATGLVPLEAWAEICGIQVPTVTSMIELCSRVMLQNYRSIGRNSHLLGIEGVSKEDFIAKYS
jgi:opine dehydrogenase